MRRRLGTAGARSLTGHSGRAIGGVASAGGTAGDAGGGGAGAVGEEVVGSGVSVGAAADSAFVAGFPDVIVGVALGDVGREVDGRLGSCIHQAGGDAGDD